MKKIGLIITLLAGLALLNSVAYSNSAFKKVYISQIVDHPALDITRKGIVDQLAAEGFIDGKNINLKFATAQGDLVLSNQIAQKFAADKPDCMVAIGTTMAQSLANSSKANNLNVVFSSVTNPSEAKLTNMNNITGVSNFIKLDDQLKLFKELLPNLSKLGFIYNPSEANSLNILQQLKLVAQEFNIDIVTSIASKTTDISAATAKLVGKVEAIFISNDNTALSAFGVIAKIATAAKLPLYVSDTDLVANGAIASLGPNQYSIGQQTGKMIAKILRGENPKDLPIEFPNKVELVLNIKAADAMGLRIPDNIIQKADKVIR